LTLCFAAGARARDWRDAKSSHGAERRGRSDSGVPESPVFLPGYGQKNAPEDSRFAVEICGFWISLRKNHKSRKKRQETSSNHLKIGIYY
jgi:hypothetical protein